MLHLSDQSSHPTPPKSFQVLSMMYISWFVETLSYRSGKLFLNCKRLSGSRTVTTLVVSELVWDQRGKLSDLLEGTP